MSIQAVLFPKDLFTETEANNFLEKKNLKKIKPFHITSHFIRARIRQPFLFRYFRTITLPNKIEIVRGFN